jgi:parallel beta-helix repeat protein
MNPMWKIIFGLVLILFVTVPAGAGILYVDNSIACPGNGSTGSPYCSIQNAFNVVNPGDSIRIRTGTGIYDANSVLTRSGTSGNPIIIEPDTGANFIVRYSGNGAQDAAMRLRLTSYVTIQNITFDGAGVWTSLYAIQVQASESPGATVSGLQFLNNTFKNWNGTEAQSTAPRLRGALMLDGGFCSPTCIGKIDGALVRGNTFLNNRDNSIAIMNMWNSVVENNDISGVKCGVNTDNTAAAVGIFIQVGVSYGSDFNVFRNNTIHDFQAISQCSFTPKAVWSGLWCDVGPSRNELSGNHIYNISQGVSNDIVSGTLIEAGCFQWTVKNNVVHDVGWAGFSIRNYGNVNPANWTEPPQHFYNNTIYNALGRAFSMGAGKVEIKNNIVYGIGTSALVSLSQDSASVQSIDYNLYYDTNWNNHVGQTNFDNGGQPNNLATWRTICQCDTHSLFANPLFVNPPSDSHLQSSSPARGAGQDGVDIGAFPYVSGVSNGVPTPPTNLIATSG